MERSKSYYVGILTLPLTMFFGVMGMLEFLLRTGEVTISNLLLTLWLMIILLTFMFETDEWNRGMKRSKYA